VNAGKINQKDVLDLERKAAEGRKKAG